MKNYTRLLAFALLLILCLTAVAGCTTPAPGEGTDTSTKESPTEKETDPVTETEEATEAPVPGVTVDSSYRIVISANADEITQKTAAMVAATIQEKAGITLSVVTDAEASLGHEIVLGSTNRAESNGEMGWTTFVNGQSIHIDSGDPITLYYAAEAVLAAWLTEDFGLTGKGTLFLPEERIQDLNGLTTRRDNSLRILSQNVRYADDPNGNSISERTTRLQALILEYQPDLIGTQETTNIWNAKFRRINKYLRENTDMSEYAMVGCSREGRDASTGEWNTILYRKDRFELLDSDTTWLSDTPNEASAVEGALCKRICTWALLKDKQTGETILFANTHLDHSNDEVRSVQMNILMDYLSEHIGQYPFYVTGDFNCYVDSIPYNTATERLLDAHKTTWTDTSTVTRTYHGYKETGGGEIDFIFHNEKTTPVWYEIISKDYDGFVSDHYGVIAEFVND